MGRVSWHVAAGDRSVPQAIGRGRSAVGIPQATTRSKETPAQAAERGQDQTCGNGQAAEEAEGPSTKMSNLVHNISSTQGCLLYRRLAERLKGFVRAGPARLFRKFVDTPGMVETAANQVIVHLSKRAHNPLLKEAGLTKLTRPVPWLGGRSVRL